MNTKIHDDITPIFEPSAKFSTFTDVLRWRAQYQPERTAYTFLTDSGDEQSRMTYKEMNRQARAVAATIQKFVVRGERVLLLYPPGPDYVAAFFGCLYTGVVAVPAYPPRANHHLSRLEAIIADAKISLTLTTPSILPKIEPLLSNDAGGLRSCDTNSLEAGIEEEWQDPASDSDTLAFLQYTSGSTGTPKGVMLSHGNLLHNSSLLSYAFEYTPDSYCVSWLPAYHDMGLIGGILQPLYGGFPCTLMSPAAFLQRPLRWLQAISRNRATISGGPDFAYELCSRRITPEQKADLDLSSWSVAFNGSEPLRPETLQRFVDAFEICGFRREAFYPCYGLAESTLIVSGSYKTRAYTVEAFEAKGIETRQVRGAREGEAIRWLVSSGRTLPNQRVAIVDPESRIALVDDQIGEVWVCGPSIARGYWNQPDETERTFNAYIEDTGEGPFLRTGDLGFLKHGELFITGRLKDLIIIRGLNHYPQDIELTVEDSHTMLRPNSSVAFSIEAAGEERLVVVIEVSGRQRSDFDNLFAAARTAVSQHHELQLYALALVKPGGIPKTSSGKMQRHLCREMFLAGTLPVIDEWRGSVRPDVESFDSEPSDLLQTVEPWLVSRLAAVLGIAPRDIDPDQSISSYGLDSLSAIELANMIENHLSISLPMVRLLQGSTIRELAAEVEAGLSEQAIATESIRPHAEREYRLSHGQKALWFLHQLVPDGAAYNLVAAVRIKSQLDVEALRRSLQSLVNRHPCLRTTFNTVQGEPVQIVHDIWESLLIEHDASTLTPDEFNRLLVEHAHSPFDLERGPLLQVKVFNSSANEYVLLLVVHHIIADFWSLGLMVHELGIFYEAEKSGASATLIPLRHSYSDYVRWQADLLTSAEGERLWSYWRNQLEGDMLSLDLPTDRPRPPVQTYQGASHPFKLDAELTARLKTLARTHGVTLYTLLLTVFQTLLYRYTSQTDFLVGSLMAGRNKAQWAEIIGYFVNPLVIRARVSDNLSFEDFLHQVQQTLLSAFEHQDYPFPLLVERLQPVRDASRSPLFQVMFVLQKARMQNDQALASLSLGEEGAHLELGGLKLESFALETHAAQFDLTLVMAETIADQTEVALGASLQYNTDLFDAQTIARMAGHFERLLDSVIENSRSNISDLTLMTAVERRQLLEEWNHTNLDYPREQCVHHAFEAQAAASPDAIAVVFEGSLYTYGELNRRANQLAHYLIKMGAGPEVQIALCMERSIEMMVGLMGILKAGAAYVPLDPTYPKERIDFVLEDVQSPVVLTQERLKNRLGNQASTLICLDTDWSEIARHSDGNPSSSVVPQNLAYVIYTSGSSGKPKGVMIAHQAVMNFFAGMDERIGLHSQDTLLSTTSISFDISVLELFWTLARGAKVILLSEQALSEAPAQSRAKKNARGMQFSLFYFASNDVDDQQDKYRLLLEGARFADEHGFVAVWTPERHFHQFGGLYPNPSVMSAALAVMTKQVQIRAGSVVLPLHNVVRAAEEWSLVDNLSKGRAAIAFASGWHSDDFAFFPENYAERREIMYSGIETFKRLWRGESITVRGGAGNDIAVKIFPRPVQRDLPIWITAAGGVDTFIKAGEIGANVLTHLLGQSIEEVAEKISLYREARARSGNDPGHITLMLHTFVGKDLNAVREKVRVPFINYLRTSIGLIANLIKSMGLPLKLETMSEKDMNDLLDFAFARYFDTSALFGTQESCAAIIDRLKEIDVDEVACLVDFGVGTDEALDALPALNAVKEISNDLTEPADYSLPAQAARHLPTLLQCTPSMSRMIFMNSHAVNSLQNLRALMLGGEALPATLAKQAKEHIPARLINMYGPTETTIWSATQEIEESVRIGQPIANTQIYILGKSLHALPTGVTGELYIAGDGLARGYLNRPELSAERFIPDHFSNEPGTRLYRTGDITRFAADGGIEFLGRADHQVKLRGFRIELGEIEIKLSRHPAVREAVAQVREDSPGDARLIAYIVPDGESAPSISELRSYLKESLPDYMVPAIFIVLESLPLTSNGKIDRKALPAPESIRPALDIQAVAPRNNLERIIAGIWQKALKVERVGINDNFFDLGGHSLLMAQVHSQLREVLKKDFPLIALLEHPTVSSLAGYISEEQTEQTSFEQQRERADKQRQGLKRHRQNLMRARQ